MKIVLSPRAEKQLKKLPKVDQIAVARKIRAFKKSSPVSGEEKLKGLTDIFRVRVGQYRIVYKKTATQAYIVLIRHRKDVYQLVKQLLQ